MRTEDSFTTIRQGGTFDGKGQLRPRYHCQGEAEGSWIRKFQPLLLLLIFAVPAVAQAQFTYSISNGAVSITDYVGVDDVVTIPSTIEGLPVVSIRGQAFSHTDVTSVTIPNSVTIIGDDAFNGCDRLTSVAIGSSVTSIGARAFSDCDLLTNVSIPNGVTVIGDSAFRGCQKLSTVELPSGLTYIGNSAFERCRELKGIIIPEGVIEIGEHALSDCRSLTDVALPNSVTSVSWGLFSYCQSLTNVRWETQSAVLGS
jgi:hypothetical protein